MSRHGRVDLIDQQIYIPLDGHAAIAEAIAAAWGDEECDGIEDALDHYDLVPVEDSDSGAIVEFCQDCNGRLFMDDELFAALAPHVTAGDFLTFRVGIDRDGYTCRVVFDGQGSFRTLPGSLVFADRDDLG